MVDVTLGQILTTWHDPGQHPHLEKWKKEHLWTQWEICNKLFSKKKKPNSEDTRPLQTSCLAYVNMVLP